mmetsp:Transcript_15352/g.24574  ORF Transcript_15352/g.24574 Transcript_15352/m.24574 type:complete len:87 (+) Transcript_15352:70-330(+)
MRMISPGRVQTKEATTAIGTVNKKKIILEDGRKGESMVIVIEIVIDVAATENETGMETGREVVRVKSEEEERVRTRTRMLKMMMMI